MISLKQTLLVVGIFVITLILLEAVMLLRLRGQIPRYKDYWAKQAQAEVPEGALWYVAMGDSAAQGIGANKPQNSYVGLLAATLGQKSGRAVHVVNLSVTGAKIADVISNQLPALRQLKLPKNSVITLEIGANDMASFDAARFEKDLDTLLGQIPTLTVVADVPYFGGGLFRSREKNVEQANQIFDQLITKHHLRAVALHQATMSSSNWPFDTAADLFHPNNSSYKGWYGAFWAVLDKS